ncbi:MAG: hypothetical protein D6832_03375 [Alphaproteobacteria bacterium]|nr:MAG: hypothetical protein D6832_03375 [Alphaproteobacteria bacterium]
MLEKTPAVRVFRGIVLALAAFYWIETWFETDLSAFGWQFRYLTIWGLTFNLIAAALMVARSRGRTKRRFDGFIGMTAVVNGIILFMYWRLYFIDPSLVNGPTPLPAWREYYLHGLGAVLQWIDAFFIFGAFRDLRGTLARLLAVLLAYILWIEFAVGPLNDAPAGKVTSGLPYPFLNDMTQPQRLRFYAQVVLIGLVIMAVQALIARGLARLDIPPGSRPRPATRPEG